jgi:hypothetical protein
MKQELGGKPRPCAAQHAGMSRHEVKCGPPQRDDHVVDEGDETKSSRPRVSMSPAHVPWRPGTGRRRATMAVSSVIVVGWIVVMILVATLIVSFALWAR